MSKEFSQMAVTFMEHGAKVTFRLDDDLNLYANIIFNEHTTGVLTGGGISSPNTLQLELTYGGNTTIERFTYGV